MKNSNLFNKINFSFKKIKITHTIWLVLFKYTIHSLLSKFIRDTSCHHNPSIKKYISILVYLHTFTSVNATIVDILWLMQSFIFGPSP